MNLIKKMLANPYLKSLLPSDTWTLILFLAAVFLIGLLIFLIIRRRKKAKAPEPVIQKPEEDFLSPGSLRQVWKTFLSNIPARFRRSILMYQPYIVMGEAGTGKSNLIDDYTDWKNQANQFYPSHTQDPLLQVYLGSRILVQEIPSALLHDTSSHARKALINLWKCFKRKKDLSCVITLKADALLKGDPDSLKEQAQMIRGKLNILSQILRQPVRVRIALTFMNQIQGFSEFSKFTQKNNMPFEIEVKNQNDLKNLENFIRPYEQYLSNALISETSNDYLKMISFYQSAPHLLSGLSRFIHILTDPDPLSASPGIDSIFFTEDNPSDDKPLSNPFKTQVSIKKVRAYHPLKKHIIAAALMVIICVSYLLFSYFYKQNHTQQIMANLNKIDDTKIFTNQSDLETFHQISSLLSNLEVESAKVFKENFLIDFFPDAQKQINARVFETRKILKEKIIQNVLGSELTPLSVQDDAYKKNLLLLALIYSSNSNELGKFINEHIDFWVTTCNIPRHIIVSYISLSDTTWNKVIPLKGLVAQSQQDNTQSFRSWLLFLRNVEKFQKKSYVSSKTLIRLQKEALKLIDEIDVSLQADWFDKIRGLLATETLFGDDRFLAQSSKTSLRKDFSTFKRFLDFFWKLKLDFPEVENINLEQLFENLRIMMEFKQKEIDNFNFEINKNAFYFNSGELNDLIAKSSMIMLLKNYVSYYSRYPGFSFFHPESEYEDLEVNISSDNNFYFSKKATIDGRYTKDVYESQVAPFLKELPDLLEKLPLDKAEKTYFSNFIFREVDAYTRNYLKAYQNFYKQFKIKVDSVGELRYFLTQMTLPLNPFQEFLMILNENISLDYGNNPYFDLIKSKFRPLGFVSLIMQEQKDSFPELEKYKAIIRQILVDLQSGDTIPPDSDKSELAALKTKLPSEARIGLDILLDGPESYLKMIREWGTGVGIPDKWLHPFTEPANQIYLLGQKKIETVVRMEWENLALTYIHPVMDTYPFNRTANAPATPEAVKNLVSPAGEFFEKFSSLIAPLCKKDEKGNWQARPFAMSTLQFPEDLFSQVNYITRLSKIFYNEKAEPLPFVFEVKPYPLPLVEEKLMFVVLSYLRSGKSSVFGFNQKPSWHTFNFEWWQSQDASAGVEFMDKKAKAGKIFTNITVPKSYWSFYRLLDKADTPEPMTWMWEIESPGEVQWKRAISFSIREDPWAVFQNTRLDGKK